MKELHQDVLKITKRVGAAVVVGLETKERQVSFVHRRWRRKGRKNVHRKWKSLTQREKNARATRSSHQV